MIVADPIGRLSEGVTDEDEADLQALSDDLKLLAGRLTTTLADVRANAAPVADRELTLIMSALADLAR